MIKLHKIKPANLVFIILVLIILSGWLYFNQPILPPAIETKAITDYKGTGLPLYGWAWNELLGWISFNCADYMTCQGGSNDGEVCNGSNCGDGACVDTCTLSDYGVYASSTGVMLADLNGCAWSETAGWLCFHPDTGVTTPPFPPNHQAQLGVASSSITGWARFCSLADNTVTCEGGNNGWVSLSTTTPPLYGVTLDRANNLHGYAWSNDFGWLSFNCVDKTCTDDRSVSCNDSSECATGDCTSLCPTSSYRVGLETNVHGWAWADTGICSGGTNPGAQCDADDGSDCLGGGTCNMENGIGWISINCASSTCSNFYGVNIEATSSPIKNLAGYGWNNNLGWINFGATSTTPDEGFRTTCENCFEADNCSACYNAGDGKLYGWAQAEALGEQGWIRLDDDGGGFNYGISMDSGTNQFHGWAWGAAGRCNNDGSICSTDAQCGGGTCEAVDGPGWISWHCGDAGAAPCSSGGGRDYFVYYDEYFGTMQPNSAPTISSIDYNPKPVSVGESLVFNAGWTDTSPGEQVRLHVCKVDSIDATDPDPLNQQCGSGAADAWCSTSTLVDASSVFCDYDVQAGDVGDSGFFAFVCDDENECSPSTAGSFEIHQPPFLTDQVTDDTAGSPVTPGTNINFEADWQDPNSGVNSVNYYVCDSTNFTPGTGCDDNEWCQSGLTTPPPPNNPIQCSLATNIGMLGDNDYFVFVCDDTPGTPLCSSSTPALQWNEGSFTVNDPPSISNMSAPGWYRIDACDYGALRARLSFTYNDADGTDALSAYQIIVRDVDNAVEVLDTGKCTVVGGDCTANCFGYTNGNICTYSLFSPIIDYSIHYEWDVEVWDSNDIPSGVNSYSNEPDTSEIDDGVATTFITYPKEFPLPHFIYKPKILSAGEDALFDSKYGETEYGNPGGGYSICDIDNCDWEWTVPASAEIDYYYPTDVENASTTVIRFNDPGSQDVTLNVYDPDNSSYYWCSTTTEVTTKLRLPTWIETK